MTSKRDREEEAQFEELKRMRVIGEFQPPAGFDPMDMVRRAQAFQREANEILASHGEPSPPPPAVNGNGTVLRLLFVTKELREQFQRWLEEESALGGWSRFGDWRDEQPDTDDH
jgi:hypothetical protein